MSAEPTPLPSFCLRLPAFRSLPWQLWLPSQLPELPRGDIEVDTGDWNLSCRDLEELINSLHAAGHGVLSVVTRCHETLISASALGLVARQTSADIASDQRANNQKRHTGRDAPLIVHRGTLRSGDHIESQGHVLIVGDVNPGGSVSAHGDVYVWGRLRGRAHAGRHGDCDARIVALQLRPLQLRIAELVARGPEERPQPGLAEQACVQDGAISIEPAKPPFAAQQT